jgi:hypothetical protein
MLAMDCVRLRREKELLLVVAFKEEGIDKDSRSHQYTLLVHRCLSRKVNFKGIGIREEFDAHALWFLEDLTQIRSIAAGSCLVRIIDAKGRLAASLTARIPFSAAVDANATAAGGLMKEIKLLLFVIENLKRRDANKKKKSKHDE